MLSLSAAALREFGVRYYDEFRKFLSPKQVQKVFDEGMMNPGMFNREMNRRAHMRTSDGKHSSHK